MDVSGRRTEIEIGELVLEGLDRRVDPDLLVAAFTAELERLVSVVGVPASGRTCDVVGELPELPRTVSAERLGVALARSVHSGLRGGRRTR